MGDYIPDSNGLQTVAVRSPTHLPALCLISDKLTLLNSVC
jgi:hypothetical protein